MEMLLVLYTNGTTRGYSDQTYNLLLKFAAALGNVFNNCNEGKVNKIYINTNIAFAKKVDLLKLAYP